MTHVEERKSKRRKTEHTPTQLAPDIKGAFELHDLLRFKQSAEPEVKTNVDTFRAFLTSIDRNEDADEKQVQLQVLKQYCDDQGASKKDELDFPDLLSTWSFAAQSNTEAILSAVPAALSQFFRTISTELDFRHFGLSLCQSLLRSDQVQLIERGLSAPKFKEYLISPCLRLLTEIASFDGGALVGNVFSRRDRLLQRLDSLLDPPRDSGEMLDRRRPTVRRNAQRFLLALLKYLDHDAKAELITQGRAVYACLRNLSLDGGDIVRDILSAVRRDLVDADLPKQSKSRFLNSGNLILFVSLYDYEPELIDLQNEDKRILTVRDTVHDFLSYICSNYNGALVPQSGWYPMGFDAEPSQEVNGDTLELGLDSPYHFDEYTSSIPVKNTNLSTFLQRLKPQDDTLQAELAIDVFTHAPELVAEYLSKKQKFSLQTTEDATWRNVFAFLFSIVQLPVPTFFGWHNKLPASPPPVSVVVESILPRPLDRTTLTKCLKSKDDIVIMSVARLVTEALHKSQTVVRKFRDATGNSDFWQQASDRLIDQTAVRFPQFQDFVAALQQLPEDQPRVRSSILECIATYLEAIPKSAASAKFDVGPLLMKTLTDLGHGVTNEESASLLRNQLDHLVIIASISPVTKWWHKAKAEELSPILMLLKHSLKGPSALIERLLLSKLSESGILSPGRPAFKALQGSLNFPLSHEDEAEVLRFFENCMMRTMKQPVKYLDQLEALQDSVNAEEAVSLITVCIAEQWSFVLKNSALDATKAIISWVLRLYNYLMRAGESQLTLSRLEQTMLAQCEGKSKDAFELAARKVKNQKLFAIDMGHTSTQPTQHRVVRLPTPPTTPHPDLSSVFSPLSALPTTLTHIAPLTSPTLTFDSPQTHTHLNTLIRALSSPNTEIRLSSLTTLPHLIHALTTSPFPESNQLHLLLSSLHLTTTTYLSSNPTATLPTIISTLASLLLTILLNPADPMYRKANRFLLTAPTWSITRVIPYWLNKILLEEPESDDPNSSTTDFEHARLLELLSAGLRTRDDMELYRKAGVFERLGSLYFRPGAKREERRGVLEVVWRGVEVEGGADTLVTRCGIKAWLAIVRGREGLGELGRVAEALERRVEENCDEGYIREWERRRGGWKKGEAKVNGVVDGKEDVQMNGT